MTPLEQRINAALDAFENVRIEINSILQEANDYVGGEDVIDLIEIGSKHLIATQNFLDDVYSAISDLQDKALEEDEDSE